MYCHANSVRLENGPTAATVSSDRRTSNIFASPSAVRTTPARKKSRICPAAAAAPTFHRAADDSPTQDSTRHESPCSSVCRSSVSPAAAGTSSSVSTHKAEAADTAASAVSRRYARSPTPARMIVSALMPSACAAAGSPPAASSPPPAEPYPFLPYRAAGAPCSAGSYHLPNRAAAPP